MDDAILKDLVSVARKANRIAILTGAGISAESGLATFRGSDGIWSRFKPEELANMDAFLSNPERVWEWYQYRREVLDSAEPNAAHRALAEWEGVVSDFSLITQNVDGLHQQAGSRSVIELHGNLRVNRCLQCGNETSMDEIQFKGKVPTCSCGGMLRPGVVWFGEMLPVAAIQSAFEASREADVFLVIGTSALVYPAASLPEIARDSGAAIVEINPEPTAVSSWADFSIRSNAGTALPPLVNRLLISLNSSNGTDREDVS